MHHPRHEKISRPDNHPVRQPFLRPKPLPLTKIKTRRHFPLSAWFPKQCIVNKSKNITIPALKSEITHPSIDHPAGSQLNLNATLLTPHCLETISR